VRAVLILIVIVLIMVFAGWLVFDFGGNRATVEIRTEKIEQDADKVLDKSKQLLHQADEAVNKP
jgi:Flp pilus assembly protein CpaB